MGRLTDPGRREKPNQSDDEFEVSSLLLLSLEEEEEEEEEMNSSSSSVLSFRAPFTPSQWQELEHQALIFKYFMAGLPIPPDLLTPTFFHHPIPIPTMGGYCSFYGKKLDPEPGRCRRTDGKKWRCAKDAHPDSKYCHRHMHRGRSRKPVEPSSRYYQEMKQGEDHGLLADVCMNARGVVVGMGMESNWFPQSKAPQMQAGMVSKQHCFFGDEYGLAEPVKQEGQPLRPFFDEWPKMNRDSWCDLYEERSNQTQLSISIPMASSDFSATSSQSANDD